MARTLSEAESKRVLAAHGVPVLDERSVSTADEAAEVAPSLGYPVVVKLCGEGLAHKTERGLVRLGLTGPESVRAAAADVLAAARPDDGEVSVLVAPMVIGSRELIAGLVRDPQFGPCVMVGIGGVQAEAVGDVAFRLAPLDPVDAREMLEDLEARALLGEFRGEPAVDRDSVAEVLLSISRLAADHHIVSVDVNPLVVVGGRPVAVDALVEVVG